jgi:hypothetical protein
MNNPPAPQERASTAPGEVKPAWRQYTRYWPWIAISLTILVMALVRVRLREMPLERDEGEYAYAGQLMLHGIPPYKLAYNMKLPGTYAAYALIMAVFGQTASGIHLGLTLVNAASIVLVFLVGRRLLDEVAGVAAAIAYALMSLSPAVLGLQAHATHFVVLPALAGSFILLRAVESGRLASLFVSGVLFGIAFVMKQHGALFGAFGLCYLIWFRVNARKEEHAWSKIRARSVPFDRKKLGRECGAFSAGLALAYGVTCVLLWLTHVFPQFVFWTIQYAHKYISAVPLANGSEMFRESLHVVGSPNLLFWLLSGLGAILLWSDRRLRRHRFFLPGLFVFSCVSISIGLYFREHYFILLLPALALLAGVAVSRGVHLLRHSQTIERLVAVPAIGLFLLGLCSSLLLHGDIWFGNSPVKACQRIYGDTLFPAMVGISDYLRTNSAPDASIAVLGSEPEIYFYAKRRSATGYIYMYPLMELHDYALKMQDDMIREIEAARPEYVVQVKISKSWLAQPGSKMKLIEWWPDYWSGRYDLVRSIDIQGEKVEGADVDPPSPGSVLVFKRKPAASP